MSTCLHPINIRIDRTKTALCLDSVMPHNTKYRDIRPMPMDIVPVPCGKCINCLKNRQNALVSRCLAESEKRGSFVFLTLTYDEEHLPFAQSLWRIDRETGLYELVDKGEIILSARSERLTEDREHFYRNFSDKVRRDFRLAKLNWTDRDKPIYLESAIEGFSVMDDRYDYVSRITPSVCREDVRLWLKRARVAFEREHGYKLSDFSYVCVSEYGPNTCRPHYHLAFFGLTFNEAQWLTDSWTYGYKMLKVVNRVNPDGTDGFQIASRYIGKYMTKGKFDCESVLNGCAEKPRLCQSKGIGVSLIDKVRSSMCCFDLYGEYNLDTLFCPSLGRCLNSDEIQVISKEMPKRLTYDTGNGYRLPIPRLFRDKVFYHQHYAKVKTRKFREQSFGLSEEIVNSTRLIRKPSTIWSLVADSIRDNLSRDYSAKFLQYLGRRREGNLDEVVSEFAFYEESLTEITERAAQARYIDFLSHSKF